MDIHKPKHPIDSLRALGAELATVTLGILIALSLEAMVEAAHHRGLAAQARASFRTELTEVRAQIEKNRSGFAAGRGEFTSALAYLQAKIEHRADTPKPSSMNLATGFLTLSSAAWETAQATQALSYMRPEETRALATVRSDEAAFAALEAQAVQAGVGVAGLVGDPASYDRTELRAAYQVVNVNYSLLVAIDALETQMLGDIDGALKALKS